LQFHNGSREQLRLAIEIYEELGGYQEAPVHYAWALFPAPPSGERQLELRLREPAVRMDGQELPAQVGELRDGRYFAALWVYQGERVRKMLPFLRFERRGSAIEGLETWQVNGAFVPLPAPAQPLEARFGEAIELNGAELNAEVVRAGQRLGVSLLWTARGQPGRPYLVFVQVLDETNHKIAQWDGAVGGDWWPTPVWAEGQRVWQDVPLTLAEDAPPGRYRVIVGVYDPATGQRLPLGDGSDALLLGHIEVMKDFEK
jgi:hypothetical protein